MNNIFFRTFQLVLGVFLAISCSHGDEPAAEHVPAFNFGCMEDSLFRNSPFRARHRESKLKILAIGNSFTHNATTYMPWLIERLDCDSTCIAKLTRSGCSLKQHWTSYMEDTPEYEMYYSDGGKWIKEDITTMCRALAVMDWDIITIQQESSHSGIYSSYQPYLDNLIGLFHYAAPEAKTVWHSTWAYRAGCGHSAFYLYDHDPEKMYHAILESAEKASKLTDITIPATDLIWRMRQEYPEVADGFSADGYHISDPNALHALSMLWYEILVSPYSGRSALSLRAVPDDVDAIFMLRACSIIEDITIETNPDDAWVRGSVSTW